MTFSGTAPCSENTSSLFLAEVISAERQHLTCERAGHPFTACKGTSLLVDPLPGDQAVVIESEDGLFFVIAIAFSGHGSSARSMSLPDGLDIRSSGNISISTPESIILETGTIDVKGAFCRLGFSDISIEAATATMTSKLLSFVAGKLEQIAKTVETTAHWISTRAHMATKEIETLDRSLAGQTMIESGSILSMEAKTTIIHSADWVKIDSDQIHLG